QGRLPPARLARAGAGPGAARPAAPVPHHRPSGRVRRSGTSLPGAGGRVRRPARLGDGVKLTVIGCSGSFPGPDSAASCYLVEAPHEGRTFRLLLDLGSGALGPLQDHIDLRDIDAIALSHLHPDHCFDMSGLYVVRKYHPQGRPARIPVYAPTGADWHLSNAYGTTEPNGMTLPFEFHELSDGL